MAQVNGRDILELLIEGEGIDPETTPAKDWLEVLTGFVTAVEALTPLKVAVTVPSVRRGCILAELATTADSQLDEIARVVESRDVRHTIPSVRNALRLGTKFCARYSSTITMRQAAMRKHCFMIDQHTVLDSPGTVTERTTVYGRVQRVGGVEDPTITLSIPRMSKAVPCKCTIDLAEQAGTLLYKKVGLVGIVKWDTDTWEIDELKVESISAYRETALTKALVDVADAAGDDLWGDDVEAALAALWGKDE